MSSELRNTGEKHPIYKSLPRCVILEKESLYWNVPHNHCSVDDGCGDRTPACREYTHPRADSDSSIFAAIPGRTIIGPPIQVHIFQFLGTHGFEVQIPSRQTQNSCDAVRNSDESSVLSKRSSSCWRKEVE